MKLFGLSEIRAYSISLLMTTPSFSSQPAEPFTIGSFTDSQEEIDTIMSEHFTPLYQNIFGKLGYNPKFVTNPHLRNVNLARKGLIDAVILYSTSQNLLDDSIYPDLLSVTNEPIYANKLGLAALNSKNITIENEGDLRNYRIGITKSAPDMGNIFSIDNLAIESFQNFTTLFRMAKADRVDLIFTTDFMLDILLSQTGIDIEMEMVYPMGCVYTNMGISHQALGKENAESLREKLDMRLKELKQEKPELFYITC
ncbi:hypothetical protein R50073_40770 [Maricurvus nonylphenolicus]|uniref:hypothetical protein n=1 Tax=Maricurvus nonylphenolicus TaxID=1008307 RepID=UPI0036F30FD5